MSVAKTISYATGIYWWAFLSTTSGGVSSWQINVRVTSSQSGPQFGSISCPRMMNRMSMYANVCTFWTFVNSIAGLNRLQKDQELEPMSLPARFPSAPMSICQIRSWCDPPIWQCYEAILNEWNPVTELRSTNSVQTQLNHGICISSIRRGWTQTGISCHAPRCSLLPVSRKIPV